MREAPPGNPAFLHPGELDGRVLSFFKEQNDAIQLAVLEEVRYRIRGSRLMYVERPNRSKYITRLIADVRAGSIFHRLGKTPESQRIASRIGRPERSSSGRGDCRELGLKLLMGSFLEVLGKIGVNPEEGFCVECFQGLNAKGQAAVIEYLSKKERGGHFKQKHLASKDLSAYVAR